MANRAGRRPHPTSTVGLSDIRPFGSAVSALAVTRVLLYDGWGVTIKLRNSHTLGGTRADTLHRGGGKIEQKHVSRLLPRKEQQQKKN